MVGTGHGQGFHWSSKAIRVVLVAVERRISTLKDSHILRKTTLFYDVMVFGRFWQRIQKDAGPKFGRDDIASLF